MAEPETAGASKSTTWRVIMRLGNVRFTCCRPLLAAYDQAEDLISIGAYQSGTNPLVDQAIGLRDRIKLHLQQSASEQFAFQQSRKSLLQLARLREGFQAVGQRSQ